MRTFLTVITLSVIIALAGCIEHRPTDTVYRKPKQEQPLTPKKILKGLRVYEGSIPCADCPGIYQRLVLKGDSTGIFRLTEIYHDATEDGADQTLVTTGSWKRYKKEIDSTEVVVFYLSEGSLKDSTRIIQYEVSEHKVVLLGTDSNRIKSAWRYTLKLVRKTN